MAMAESNGWVTTPNHMTAPALRGGKNAPLQGGDFEVDRDSVTVRVINGLGQHTNTSQKGAILSARAISPENAESRKIAPSGNRLMLARTSDGRPLIPSYREFRLVSSGNVKNPLRPLPFPSDDQIKDVGWFCWGTPLIEIGLSTMASYPKLGPILVLRVLGNQEIPPASHRNIFIIKRNQLDGQLRND